MVSSREKKVSPSTSAAPADPASICFGLDRSTDERSLIIFLSRLADRELLETLAARLADDEIEAVVDILSRLMKKHLSHREYHQLFLGEGTDGETQP